MRNIEGCLFYTHGQTITLIIFYTKAFSAIKTGDELSRFCGINSMDDHGCHNSKMLLKINVFIFLWEFHK